jgi:protein SCO1/2
VPCMASFQEDFVINHMFQALLPRVPRSAAHRRRLDWLGRWLGLGGLRPLLQIAAAGVLACALGGCGHSDQNWQLTNVQGHLPDLSFSLTSDRGQPVTAKDFKGDVLLVYFGYTHCPDVCPETMARLTQVLSKLGNDARRVRILFITVDPARDTPQALHGYVTAFDAQHAVGLSGTDSQVRVLARDYRVAYQADQPTSDGNYTVTHSSAVYIFDNDGRARLLATSSDSIDAITHDLRQLVQSSS